MTLSWSVLLQHGVVAVFGLGRGDVADRLQRSALVEPVDLGQHHELDGLEGAPRPSRWMTLRLAETIDRLGESVGLGSPTLLTEGSMLTSARRCTVLSSAPLQNVALTCWWSCAVYEPPTGAVKVASRAIDATPVSGADCDGYVPTQQGTLEADRSCRSTPILESMFLELHNGRVIYNR